MTGISISFCFRYVDNIIGTNITGEYVHMFTDVPKEKKAGEYHCLKKNLKNKISNCEAINKNILKVNLMIYGYNITLLAI